MPVKPSRRYRELMRKPGFVADAAQRRTVALLDDLFERIVDAPAPTWWQRVVPGRSRPATTRGLYLWGGVGRGKTLLMDLFYQALDDDVPRRRAHFHGFMNRIHAELKRLPDVRHPLRQVARDLAAQTRVLCLDEFVIIDIGDAMIMAGLLETLFAEGVVLVTTSNVAPKGLYRDGLQRARFLPAIDLLERHCDVVNVDGDEDYRLRFLQQTDLYRVPHDLETDNAIRAYLAEHVMPVQQLRPELVVNGRILQPKFCAEDTVWFHFAELCETARSQNDYLELARLFNTLILTDIRQMGDNDDDAARRFVLLVDVLYDHHVKLMCSSAVAPDALYRGKRLEFEFERTASRLIEMQSEQYLAQAHTLQ